MSVRTPPERSHTRTDMAFDATVPIARTTQPNTMRELRATDMVLVPYKPVTSHLEVVLSLAVTSMVAEGSMSEAGLLCRVMPRW